MPRPHYPALGGTRPPERFATPSAASTDAPGSCAGCKAKSAEIDRLKKEMSRGRANGSAGPPKSAAMMWAALGICAVCLVFALAAVLRHG